MDEKSIVEKLDHVASGGKNSKVLDLVAKKALNVIKSRCGSEEEYNAKLDGILNSLVSDKGEESRAVLENYLNKVK